MSNVQRRRGSSRPNRGGGRQQRPGRGRGRGVAPPNTSAQTFNCANLNDEDVDEDDCVVTAMTKTTKPLEVNKIKRKSYKIPMQKLTLTKENQDLVYCTLLHLSDNPDLAKGDAVPQVSRINELRLQVGTIRTEHQDSYLPSPLVPDDLRALPRSHQFKLDNRLVIEDSVSNTTRADDDPELVYQFQVKKLQRYGFERSRCLTALTSTDGDIGGSIELLLSQCLTEFQPGIQSTLDEAKEQRQDEAMALSAIYDDKFTEKIPNKIWLVDMDLPLLTKLTMNRNKDGGQDSPDKRPICDYYLKGHCKFGKRCRLRHVSQAEIDAEKERASRTLFSVEIRFPVNSLYPYEPPLIGFLSESYFVKPDLCLKISDRLMRDAAVLAVDGAPAIFTVLALFDDEDELKKVIDAPQNELSLQPKTEAPPVDSAINEEESCNSNDEAFTDSDTESLPDIKEYLKAENKVLDKAPEESPVTIALRRKKKEGKLYDVTPDRMKQDNLTIRRKFKKMQTNITYQKLLNQRKELPAWSKRETIVNTVQTSQVTVISGTTGCGKTTQVPQFILDSCINDNDSDLGQIVCTQPRRISALAVAERVAEERNERLGDVVGYQIRLESRMSSYTRLLYCTTGILLRRLDTDSLLVGVSHVIIDEVHERSEDSDFLMMIIRDLCNKRPDLKLVLMSATLNADLFSQYFNACPVIDIPGKTFPVTRRYLEDVIEVTNYSIDADSVYARPKTSGPTKSRDLRDLQDHEAETALSDGPTPVKGKVCDRYLSYKQLCLRYNDYKPSTVKTMFTMDLDKINNDLIEKLLKYIIHSDLGYPRDGAILIFMPGFMEINALYDQLTSAKPFNDKSRFKVIPLHSSLSADDQQAVFRKLKGGIRKIVIATNIAETSITIDDVVFVIDTGRMKERRYDTNRNMESLDSCWVSCANAIQREGRAGRVAPGICYHLFTYNQFHHQFRDQPIPEIQRVPLEQIILKIKILEIFSDMDVEDVLNKLLEPPTDEAITTSLERLQDLGALDREKRLTSLGYHLAYLPVDVRIGKLMLYGVIMRCLDPALTIAASLNYKTPFISPFSKRDEAEACKLEFSSMNSDHVTTLRAYNAWLNVDKTGSGYNFCIQNFLSLKTLQMLSRVKRQLVEYLSDIGFISGDVSIKTMERSACRGSDGVKENIPPELNAHANDLKIVSSVICAALYPQVVQLITPERRYYESGAGAVAKQPNAEELKFKTKRDGYVFIHPSSVNFTVRQYDSPFLVYHEKVKTSKVYLRDCSMVSPYSLVLFAGGEVHIALDKDKFVVFIDDGWIRFVAQNYQVANLLKELRHKFDHLLQEKIENPDLDLAKSVRGSKIINTIVTILSTQ